MERRWRCCILILAVAVFIPVCAKNRTVPVREQAVFLHYTSGYSLIKVKGTHDLDGVYRFSDGVTLRDVKKMTNATGEVIVNGRNGLDDLLNNGDLVEFSKKTGNSLEMTVKTMTASEMILLGIPLDPDGMSRQDWESLPGIGPALAKAIIDDRQKNGDFGKVGALLRVPGIGKGKLELLRKYF